MFVPAVYLPEYEVFCVVPLGNMGVKPVFYDAAMQLYPLTPTFGGQFGEAKCQRTKKNGNEGLGEYGMYL